MQTLQVIESIRWIESLIPSSVANLLLESNLFVLAKTEERSDLVMAALGVIMELVRSGEAIRANPRALAVLDGFGLRRLIDPTFLKDLAGYIGGVASSKSEITGIYERELVQPWQAMVSTVPCWETLTIPPVLMGPEKRDEVLTLMIGGKQPTELPVALLSEATAEMQTLYTAIARAYQIKDPGGLSLIKVESGSDVRLDCRGLGDVVRHLKDFFIEAWHKIRHKRPEEVIENNRALLSSIAVIERIEAAESSGSLPHEDATRLRLTILNATFSLFEHGVLIQEIPEQETVNNQDLLVEGFAQKLLPAPEKKPEPEPRAKRKRKKKPKAKNEQPEETEGAVEEPPQ